MANEREFGWEDVIENDGGAWELLPEGDYSFTVVNFTRGRHPGSAKLPPCNKAVVTLAVQGPSGVVNMDHNLFLHSKCEGLLCAFFTALGMRRHGEQLRMNWPGIVGKTGRCHITVRTYKKDDGTEGQSNDIKKFLEPEQPVSAATAGQGWTAGAF